MTILLVLLSVIVVNFSALAVGSNHNTRLHRATGWSGLLGIGSTIALFVAVVDAFTQIWVRRPEYEGLPVIILSVTTLAVTLASLVLSIIVVVKDRQGGA